MSDEDVLVEAEHLGIKKLDNNGVVRKFVADDSIQNFGEDALTISDVHHCVGECLDSIKCESVETLPGLLKLHDLHSCTPILDVYRENGFIDIFPIHDHEKLKRLFTTWQSSSFSQSLIKTNPSVLHEIRNYFGDGVALYFAFLALYNKFLIFTFCLAAIQYFVLPKDNMFCDMFVLTLTTISVSTFLEVWKRRSNKLSYTWGTSGKLRHKRPRAKFRGTPGLNAMTGQPELQYPFKDTLVRIMFISFPITFACLLTAFIFMLLSFMADDFIVYFFMSDERFQFSDGVEDSSSLEWEWTLYIYYYTCVLVTYIPSILYSLFIICANCLYSRFAHILTESENHRTELQFEKHVVLKLVAFEFVNTFLALFYIAFYLQDMEMLKHQLIVMFSVMQVVNQVQETLLPIFMRIPSNRKVIWSKVRKAKVFDGELTNGDMISKDLSLNPYDSTFDDFMELWLQFGHIFLFSTVSIVYPVTIFISLVNNIIELKLDSIKLCVVSRKPVSRMTRDIGSWLQAFSWTSKISIFVNVCLLTMKYCDLTSSTISLSCIFTFVAFEHVLLVLNSFVDILIPDESDTLKRMKDNDKSL